MVKYKVKKAAWEKEQDNHMFSIEREGRYDQLQALIKAQSKDMRTKYARAI
jgi:hypothetical protein